MTPPPRTRLILQQQARRAHPPRSNSYKLGFTEPAENARTPLIHRQASSSKGGPRTRAANAKWGATRPTCLKHLSYAADFALPGCQMLIWRVSGISMRPSTKHTAGTAIG